MSTKQRRLVIGENESSNDDGDANERQGGPVLSTLLARGLNRLRSRKPGERVGAGPARWIAI
jgi:hypothetical protein